MNRRSLIWSAVVLVLLHTAITAQVPLTAVPLVVVQQEVPVYVTEQVRLQLNLAWADHNAQQPERAYCLVVQRRVAHGDTVNVVERAYRAVPVSDDAYQVTFDCGPRQPYLHVHTPTTCEHDSRTGETMYDTCVLDGHDAYLCQPSAADQALANHEHNRFLLIQCGRNAFIAYFPEIIAADGTSVSASP